MPDVFTLLLNKDDDDDTQCFIGFPNTEKWVEKRGAPAFFKTNFDTFAYRTAHSNLFLTPRVIHKLKTMPGQNSQKKDPK